MFTALAAEIRLPIQRNRLPIGVLDKPVQRILAPDARLFVAAECLVRGILMDLIYPNSARLELRSDPLGSFEIGSPHRCSETVAGVVAPLNDVLFIAPLEYWQNRAKRLLNYNPRIFRWIVDEGHGNEPPARIRIHFSAQGKTVAVRLAVLYEFENFLILRLVLDGS
jgi:hypothetical protein